jgi:FkbM family methyltransferase
LAEHSLWAAPQARRSAAHWVGCGDGRNIRAVTSPLRTLKTALLYPLRRHAHSHALGAGTMARLCRFYIDWYENIDPNGASNGEDALLARMKGSPFRVVFDVGANEGSWTAIALTAFPQASFHLFEPIPDLGEALRRRFTRSSVMVSTVALSDRAGRATLYVGQSTTCVSSLHGAEGGKAIDVDLLTGDAYCERHKIERIDYLKIDAEGHDFAVLKGLGRMLREGRIAFIQFEHNEASVLSRTLLKDFVDFLGPDYRLSKIMPYGLEPVAWTVQLERFRYGNYLAQRVP